MDDPCGVFDKDIDDKKYVVHWNFVEDEGVYLYEVYVDGVKVDGLSLPSNTISIIVDAAIDDYWATREGDF